LWWDNKNGGFLFQYSYAKNRVESAPKPCQLQGFLLTSTHSFRE
jgi:hypothetical protein